MPRKTVHSWTSARPPSRPASQPALPFCRPQSSTPLSQPSEICLHVWAAPARETKERADENAARRPSGCRECQPPFFLPERKRDFTTNRCGLVTPRGCSRPAGPSGPRGVFTARLLWRMIRLDTLSTELVLLQQHILWR